VIVPGSASASYVAALGADPAVTWRAPNAVDNTRFAVPATLRDPRAEPVRFLFAGRLESAKGVATLLDAWNIVPPGSRLTIAGNGTLAERLGERVSRTLAGVDVVGHLDRDALARAYADADVFVFPSVSDPWGLVVNEAMAAGLPIVASSAPGAVDDLVIQGENGIVVAPHDVAGFARAIVGLAGDRERRLAMGRASVERIARFTPEAWAGAMRAAIVGRAA
jgi:glycosyltransferase involved in cell wall biosynthesis